MANKGKWHPMRKEEKCSIPHMVICIQIKNRE